MAKSQKIGRLRHRVDLLSQSDDPVSNAVARMNQVWAVVATVWGDVKPFSARAIGAAMYLTDRNVNRSNTHEIRIRYNPLYQNRGMVSHIRHKVGAPFGSDVAIPDADINDTTDIVTETTILATTGDEYAVVFTNMTNTSGNFFLRALGGNTYSLHPTALDATNDTNIVDLVKSGVAQMDIKKVLTQDAVIYEVMGVSQSDQRERFLHFQTRDMGDASTYNII